MELELQCNQLYFILNIETITVFCTSGRKKRIGFIVYVYAAQEDLPAQKKRKNKRYFLSGKHKKGGESADCQYVL